MNFPLELPLGKHIPLYGSISGRSFRLMCHPETTSQSERGFRDALSAWAAIGKAHPTLRCQGVFFTPAPCTEFDSPRCGGSVDAAHGRLRFDKHRIRFESEVCAENPRICCANTHRLRSPAGVLARSLQTLRVCLTLAPCIEFDSPRLGESVDGLKPEQDARSASHLYLAEALRGESACSLREPAPASAACRRPRPLATNAPRLFNARALHRVRFSAVSISNKKAGRYVYLPACNYWWRRGESNSGPRKPPDWHLQAQSLV